MNFLDQIGPAEIQDFGDVFLTQPIAMEIEG